MEPTTRTNDRDLASENTTEVRPSLVSGLREQCAACGAPMAPDQRYCVECGTRRGAPRFQFMEGLSERANAAPPQRRSLLPTRLSASGALLAGIATLLLAMGVGVLIGRSGNGSSNTKSPAVQVVSVAGAGGAAAGATPTTAAPATGATGGAGASKSAGGAAGGSSGGAKAGKTPPPKVVTVGAPGKGPGYQNGKFTGNFFGQ